MKDLIGLQFGRWTVISYAGDRRWNCICSCGDKTERSVLVYSLLSGKSLSCGCGWREAIRKATTTHGKSQDPIYNLWQNMQRRCFNEKDKEYNNYGGRGITVCEHWFKFENFWDDFGHSFPGKPYSLDRVNNDGNYELGNVRWATPKEQAFNRRVTHKITFDGRDQSASAWSEEWGIPVETVCYWIRKFGRDVALTKVVERLSQRKAST